MPKKNVNSIKTNDYGKNPAFAKNRNKAKTNPNKANLPASKTLRYQRLAQLSNENKANRPINDTETDN